MDREEFKHEYGLEKLELITPVKRDFKMLVTPGFYVNWYGGNVFEDFTSELLLNHSKDNMLFIDVGAHYGYYTLLVGTSHPGCKTIAFEPVPENFEILKQNAALNQLRNIELHNLAVSNKDELRKLRVTEISSRSSLYEQPWENTSKEIGVRTIHLDGFLKETPKVPVIIKVDVEGHETYVLQGMRKLLRNTEDIKLIIEFNPRCLKNAGSEPTEFLKEVFQYGFDIYVIDDNKRMTYKLKPDNLKKWIDYLPEGDENRNANLLCIKKEKSLSLLFFSHSSQLAGAERSLLELSKQLVTDYGVICSVVLPNEGPLRGKFDEAGISTLTIDYHWWCGGNIPSPEEVRVGLSSSFENVLNILGDLGKINPDVIFTNTLVIPWGAVAASFLGKPHVWFIREFGELDHKLKFHLPFQTILKIIRDSSNLILTNSNAVKNTLFGKVSSENILTIYPHIDIPSSTINKDENSYFTRIEATKLIIFGSVMESKGQKDAFLAVKELIQRRLDVELIVMGYTEPVYLEQLKEIIEGENLGAYVKFIYFKENPYPIVNQADIAIVCSRNEALGRITLESMLLRKPVIGTNIGGTPELIKDGFNGFLYEPGNYCQLADKIEHLIRHREKIGELGENGYKFVKENFTKEKSSGLLVELLKELKGTANNSSDAFSQFIKGATLTTLSALKSLIDCKDAQITELSNALQIKQEENTAFHHEIRALRGEITEIQDSLGWQMLKIYALIVNRILPSNSTRRKFYSHLTKLMKLLFFNPKRFLKRLKSTIISNWIPNQLSIELRFKRVHGVYNPIDIPTMLPTVDIIIVTYNSSNTIEACLKSIHQNKYPSLCNIHIWDNASKDNTLEIIRGLQREFTQIRLYESKRNIGFGKAINKVTKSSNAELLLFLNPDCVLYKETLTELASSAVYLHSFNYVAFEARQVPYEHPHLYDPVSLEVEWVSAACLLVSREAFTHIGGFDESIFLYGEDVDLSWRLRIAGYRLRYVPSAVVEHNTFADEKTFKPAQHIYGLISNFYLRLKYGAKTDIFAYFKLLPEAILYKPKYTLSITVNIIIQYIKFIVKRSRKKYPCKNQVARFIKWDYEIRRQGAFVKQGVVKGYPMVSIIIRTYARPDYLRDALQSVRNQTYKNLEVIVVEDRSKIAYRVIKEFGDLRILYIHNSLTRNRSYVGNIGLKHCSGEYIMFLDDDDLLFSDAVETLLSNLTNNIDYKLCYGFSFKARTKDRLTIILEHGYSEDFSKYELKYRNFIPIGSFMFHKSLYDEMGGFNESLEYLEDWELLKRYSKQKDFLFIPKTILIFRVPLNKHEAHLRQEKLDEAYKYVYQMSM